MFRREYSIVAYIVVKLLRFFNSSKKTYIDNNFSVVKKLCKTYFINLFQSL